MQQYKVQLSQQCQELKIPVNTDFRTSILSLTDTLPAIYDQVLPVLGCFMPNTNVTI